MPTFSKDLLWDELAQASPPSQATQPTASESAAAKANEPYGPLPAGQPQHKAEPSSASQTTTAAGDADVEKSDDADAIIARLASLPPLNYALARAEAARTLGVPLKFLDPLVRAASRSQPAEDDTEMFPSITPSVEPVDVADLLNEICATIQTHAIVSAEQADAAALTVALTHVFDLVEHVPILLIDAAEPACGKTVLAETLSRMWPRPLSAAHISVSALFRSVEKWRPSLFIDEADTFLHQNPDIHGLLNAGFQRGGFVLRTEAKGDGFEPRRYSVFCPKCIAGNNLERHLPEATISRGILIRLRRKLPHESVKRLRDADPADFERLRSQLARFAIDYADAIRQARPSLPDELSDRQQDCWAGLFAIAQCAGADWLSRATRAAINLSRAAAPSYGIGNELLKDVRAVLSRMTAQKISTADLIDALTRDEERPWATYDRGRPITPRQLAGLLSAYGIRSRTVRLGVNQTPKGYDRIDFTDAFRRYLAHESEPVQSPEGATEPEDDGVY